MVPESESQHVLMRSRIVLRTTMNRNIVTSRGEHEGLSFNDSRDRRALGRWSDVLQLRLARHLWRRTSTH